ncbi:MAG TPA: Hsp70 family protein [Candidatus Limnocylindrales bacterium]|nr:Hsp70 family protein [Candidatus Limnocylindrales bacterium]
MRFGLDFGTSNTSLAVWDGAKSAVLPIDPLAGAAMPTVLYVRRDGSSSVGRPAIEDYLSDNRSRGPIQRQYVSLGVKLTSSNKFQKPVEAMILTDVASPGRLFQALKSFLGDKLDVRTNVFGEARGLEQLISVVLGHVRERAHELTGERPETITIGRPVEYIGGVEAERRAVTRMRTAADLAGFKDVQFVFEPVGAAHSADVQAGRSLVFDFGGGTLDLAVVERTASGVRVLATAGRDIGGDRCTERVIDDSVAPKLGSRAEWSDKRLRLPAFIVNALHDWHALSALNEKPLLDALDELVRAGAPRRELEALRDAISLQLGYEIFMAADATKCQLSTLAATILTYHHASVDVDARLTRGRFETLIAPMLQETESLLDGVMAKAGVSAEDLGEVVTTGGSSAIPAFRALLGRKFPRSRVRDAAAFTSVAAGLAMPGAQEAVAAS